MPIEDQSRYYRDYNENLKNDIHCLLTISDKARDTGKQINRTFSFNLPMSLTLYHNFFSVFFVHLLTKKGKNISATLGVWDPHGLNFCVVTFEQVGGQWLTCAQPPVIIIVLSIF